MCLRAPLLTARLQVHKVGGTTLRHALLRVAARANATVGVLGCTAQREPLRAHLSASHVVCPVATRCGATAHPASQRLCAHASAVLAPPQGLRAHGAAGAQPLRGKPQATRAKYVLR